MVSLKAPFLASAILARLPLSQGRVVSMVVPASVPSGTNLTAVLLTQSYIQIWNDFGVIWGLMEPISACDQCVGSELSYNNIVGTPAGPNITFSVPIPVNLTAGDYVLVAGVPYLVGASGETGISLFKSNITVS